MYYNHNIATKYKYACHVSHPHLAGAHVGPRGSATWPSATSHLRGSRTKIYPHFNLFLIVFSGFKAKINSENSKKIPKN